jgi:hypothetical protein
MSKPSTSEVDVWLKDAATELHGMTAGLQPPLVSSNRRRDENRRGTRVALAAFVVVALIAGGAVLALQEDDPATSQANAPSGRRDTPRATGDATRVSVSDTQLEQFRDALQARPLFQISNVMQAESGVLNRTADFLLTGVIDSVDIGGPALIDDPGGPSVHAVRLNVRVSAAEALHASGNGQPINVGDDLTLELTIGPATPAGGDNQAAAAVVSATPLHATIVAYVVGTRDGTAHLAHPEGWAIVNPDGTLLGLPIPGGHDRGLGGARTLDELP